MITIKFDENEEIEELIKFLRTGEGDFELPRFINIPKGERSLTNRARMLMLAGLDSLKRDYPKKCIENYSSIEVINNAIKVESKKIENDIPKSWV